MLIHLHEDLPFQFATRILQYFSKNPDMFGKKMDHISKAADLIRVVNNSPFTEVRFMNNWDHSKKKLKLVKATFGHQTNKY